MKPKLLKRSELKPGVSYTPVDSHGEPLIGTLEMIRGIAGVITITAQHGDRIQPDWDGETKIDWDSSKTQTRRGQRIWVDAGSEEIPENRILFIEAS